MAVEYLGTGNDDGVVLGRSSTDKIGFYNATPIAKATVVWPNTTTATTALNETKVNRIMTALVNLGLIATS